MLNSFIMNWRLLIFNCSPYLRASAGGGVGGGVDGGVDGGVGGGVGLTL